ncbi:hypothetical protein [Hoylesella loescheii]|jgi:hypothetical protein|uniref:Uncharacterized protein n=1 Tax=Hoylesella loescheii DSM 19665 = JCM 12249 = ATCC 15930 TaxID=1122985 RepID=A0A069QJG4_HOYLO|nr:hypothetical protein [Hoylesella loescheii]KDR52812.1 hypothetical protein HMPREF1991_01116 [Hoylesella loescheii DSM 19665 = JCM 12249 = ATCC 15930]
MGKKIMSVLSVLLVIGAVAIKCLGPDLVKEAIKSEYKKNASTAIVGEEGASLDKPVTFKLGEDDVFTLYPDGTAKKMDSDTPLNWEELEGSSEGEKYSFIYVYEMEDTSRPRYFLTEDETGLKFSFYPRDLDDFVGMTIGQNDGDISTNLLVSAIKVSKKNKACKWEKYICKEGEEL